MSLVWTAVGLVIGLPILWIIGRFSIARVIDELVTDHAAILEYHNDLTECMNGIFEDFQMLEQLMVNSARVQAAMGRDNIVHGLIIDHMMLNGVTLLPRALYSIRDTLNSGWYIGKALKTGNTVRGVLLASLGRRKLMIERLSEQSRNPVTMTGRGWSAVVSVPLYLLQGLGLLSSGQTSRFAESFIFRVVSLLTFLAAIAGPLLAYLADRPSIEREIERIATAGDKGNEDDRPRSGNR